jgi:D-beta-D-heptose 7-phosphate kinase/D-beta-D-heptose 1-phosphate adenosyltransferase
MVSGGFDPIHIGHIRYIQEAKKLGDKLIVVLNNDNWLRAKKGKEFMGELERKEILEAIAGVDEVIISNHPKNPKDMSVCNELIEIRPHIFAKGGDRDEKDAQNPESSLYRENQIHKKLGIEIVFNVGKGGKVRSSSDLLKNYQRHISKKGGKAQKLSAKYHRYAKKKKAGKH